MVTERKRFLKNFPGRYHVARRFVSFFITSGSKAFATVTAVGCSVDYSLGMNR